MKWWTASFGRSSNLGIGWVRNTCSYEEASTDRHILHSGGINGIVELEILRLVQVVLGGKIPLRAFFDLIVGTRCVNIPPTHGSCGHTNFNNSCGGIIALGIGVEGWSIDRCIEEFKTLCRPAFTPRRGHNIWGIAQMIQAHNGSIYSTQPLQKALQDMFSSDPLFGGQRLVEALSKVALTTTSAAGLQPTVLSNYNRTTDYEEKSMCKFSYCNSFRH